MKSIKKQVMLILHTICLKAYFLYLKILYPYLSVRNISL